MDATWNLETGRVMPLTPKPQTVDPNPGVAETVQGMLDSQMQWHEMMHGSPVGGTREVWEAQRHTILTLVLLLADSSIFLATKRHCMSSLASRAGVDSAML